MGLGGVGFTTGFGGIGLGGGGRVTICTAITCFFGRGLGWVGRLSVYQTRPPISSASANTPPSKAKPNRRVPASGSGGNSCGWITSVAIFSSLSLDSGTIDSRLARFRRNPNGSYPRLLAGIHDMNKVLERYRFVRCNRDLGMRDIAITFQQAGQLRQA